MKLKTYAWIIDIKISKIKNEFGMKIINNYSIIQLLFNLLNKISL